MKSHVRTAANIPWGRDLDDEFPELYSDCFECTPARGWYQIVRSLSQTLSQSGLPVKIQQVKAKWGQLCVYWNDAEEWSDEHRAWIEAEIARAEQKAKETYACCGAPRLGSDARICETCAALDALRR